MSTSSTTCSDSVCSICLDTCSVVSYADGCLHKFCGRCIFEWAQRSQLCPICRTFFANIITNVTSDTDYEVIPLEDRRVPVSNFIRNSWWNNNSYPSNRNIFAVRQFNQRSSQHQQYHQPSQLPSSSSDPPPRAISQHHQRQQHHQQQQRNEGYQAISRLEEPDIGNLQIDNPRPRRIVWSSNRYSNRQFNRQQPQPTSSHHENVVALRQIISPAFRTDYHNRGHNQPLTSPRHSTNPRPFRPLVGVRQENHQNQNQNQPQQNHQHSSQSTNQLNVNYQQPHHSHSHSYPQQHSHPQSQSHPHPHPQSHPHPHHYHYNSSVHSHNSHQTQPHHSHHHHHLHSHPHSGPHPHPHPHPHHHHHHQQTACKRLSSRPNERQWRR